MKTMSRQPPPARKLRLRIRRLEDRIAPKCVLNPQGKPTGRCFRHG